MAGTMQRALLITTDSLLVAQRVYSQPLQQG